MTQETKTEPDDTVEEIETDAIEEVDADKVIESEEFTEEKPEPEKEPEPDKETEKEEPDSEAEPTDEQDDKDSPAKRVVPKADDYSFDDSVPEVLRGDLAKFANENDMTQKQLDATVRKHTLLNEQARQAEQALFAKEGQEFVKSWGEEAKTNLNLAHQGLSHYDESGEVTKLLKDSGQFQRPFILKFFNKIGADLAEGGFLKSSGHAPTKKKTFADALFPQFKD